MGEPAVGPSPGSGQRAAEGGVAYFLRERGRDKAAAPVQAEGRDTAQGFVVLAGATGPLKDKVMSPGYARLRASLRQDGTLGVVGNSLRLTRDYPFQSPSAAAAVLTGGNRPGPDVWKDAHGSSLASRRATASEQATVES